MSTAVQPPLIPAEPKSSEDDPYRLGWRYVTRRLLDGTEVSDQVPLTPEDVLHPEEGDFIVQTEAHDNTRNYLKNVFHYRLAGNEGALVLCDHRIAFDVPGLQPLGPDILAIFKVRPGPRLPTFDVAREGVRPSLIIEITSPTTRRNDLVVKVDYYYQAGIPYYIIVDLYENDRGPQIVLIGYRRTEVGYVRIAPNERGWLWLEPVQLWLGGQGGRVVCFEPDGKEIFDYTEVAKERDTLSARAAQAETHAAQAETRAAQAETRAAQAETQAALEAQARGDAERKLHELEEEIRRLRGQG